MLAQTVQRLEEQLNKLNKKVDKQAIGQFKTPMFKTMMEHIDWYNSNLLRKYPIKVLDNTHVQVGTKKLVPYVSNGRLFVRIGGGTGRFDDWLKKYATKEGIELMLEDDEL